MSILKRLITFLFAIFIGLIFSVWMIQSNTKIEEVLTKKLFSKLENMWGVKISSKSSRINFFTSSFYIKDGYIVDPKKENCNWSFEQCKIHISLFKFLLKKKINLYLTFDNVSANTHCNDDNDLDIARHISAMFAGGFNGLNVVPKVIQINNLEAKVFKNLHKMHLIVMGGFRAEKLGSHSKKPYSWHAKFNINDAQVGLDDKVIARDILLSGDCYKNKCTRSWEGDFKGQVKNFVPVPKHVYNLTGELNSNKKQVFIKSLDKCIDLSITNILKELQVCGNFKLSSVMGAIDYFVQSTKKFDLGSSINGDCKIDANFNLDLLALKQGSSLVISNACYKNVSLDKLECKALGAASKRITSKINVTVRKGLDFEGICSWDRISELCTLKFVNTSSIKLLKNAVINLGLTDYILAPKKFIMSAKINKQLDMDGIYKFNILDQKNDESKFFSGKYSVKNAEINMDGSIGLGEYNLKAHINPSLHFSEIKYKNKSILIDFKTENQNDLILKGELDYSLIKSLLNPTSKNLLLGRDCIFSVQVDQKDLSNIQGLVKLATGRFYIPESQNLINEIQFGFEFVPPNKLCLFDAKIGCFKGEVFSPLITIILDKFGAISFLHMPLQVNDLLVNYKRDLLSIIFGNILIKKNIKSGYKAFGQVILKRALLKENVFAAADKNNFYSRWNNFLSFCKDFEFDFKFISEQPIKVKTPAIETNASLNLRINYRKDGSIINVPQLTGNIKLDGGVIKFWQNKLRIDYGKIEFVANQMNDPIIDLIAKNRINKYMVSLQASGSLQKPTMLVESTPELTEEQILSLLLSGSESYKLQTDLLAMFELYLYNSVLGSNSKQSHSANLLKKITQTMKYIQISPDFTDQSGRGGIKGTVNVNVNDQVKAQLQKNFNLQDDFSVQLEYLLSDDVNVRAIKDQRGELGAEVELRLKF